MHCTSHNTDAFKITDICLALQHRSWHCLRSMLEQLGQSHPSRLAGRTHMSIPSAVAHTGKNSTLYDICFKTEPALPVDLVMFTGID